MRVIGTAGHVDHGKSTLVEALTGIHPDRLKEEQEREMTIDLGFAWLTLPDGEELGIVDVPGHRDFIENMLAGVGGIDAALFVIAADEGVMPQTREHLAILDLLNIQSGVVALTKIDLVEDPDWLDLVEEDIQRVLSTTALADVDIVRVSARTGEGLQTLLSALSESIAERPARIDYGRPRLPVDRVFTISGFGTVVTGTLNDGHLSVGDEIQILPTGARGRIRGLQTHKQKEDRSVPGSRTAVNISGVTVDQVKRGDVIVHPGDYNVTGRIDTRFYLLPSVSHSIKHDSEVKLYIGASEVLARIRLLGSEELRPGDEGWLQLEMKQPIIAVRGDRYILRRPSAGETLGGGDVIDPFPRGRYKRFAKQTLRRLEALSEGTSTEILFQSLQQAGVTTLKEVILASNLDETSANKALEELVQSGQLVNLDERFSDSPGSETSKPDDRLPLPSQLIASRSTVEELCSHMVKIVGQFHQAQPLRSGMPREELKSRMKVSPRIFNALIRILVLADDLDETGPLIRIPTHEIRFNLQQQNAVDRLKKRFSTDPYSPPTIKECQVDVGEDIYHALVDLGELIPVNQEVVFSKPGYSSMLLEVNEMLRINGEVSAAQVRDHLKTSRRYVLAFLEYLDHIGVTVREGDVRRLKN